MEFEIAFQLRGGQRLVSLGLGKEVIIIIDELGIRIYLRRLNNKKSKEGGRDIQYCEGHTEK